MSNQRTIHYVVSQETAQIIMNGLSQLPWGMVNPIILDLQQQATQQLSAPPAPANLDAGGSE